MFIFETGSHNVALAGVELPDQVDFKLLSVGLKGVSYYSCPLKVYGVCFSRQHSVFQCGPGCPGTQSRQGWP